MSSQDKADEILSRFPGPVALSPSRRKWILVLLGCAAFVAIGVGIMPKDKASTWFVIAFFGLGALIAAVMLLPGAGGLTLGRHGFEVTSLFRRHSFRWGETTGFTAAQIPRARRKMVVFDDANVKGSAMGSLNVALVGRTSSVLDTYGLSAEDLAKLMARWRERAV